MKKIKWKMLLIGSVMVLWIGLTIFVSAIIFSNRDDAIAEIQAQKLADVESVDESNIDITLTSDKVCRINYVTEETDYCRICYSATYEGLEYEDCVKVDEDGTEVQDKNAVRDHIKDLIVEIKTNQHTEDISYTARSMQGDRFTATEEVIGP